MNAKPRFWFSRAGNIGMLGPVAKSLALTLRHHSQLGKAEPMHSARQMTRHLVTWTFKP